MPGRTVEPEAGPILAATSQHTQHRNCPRCGHQLDHTTATRIDTYTAACGETHHIITCIQCDSRLKIEVHAQTPYWTYTRITTLTSSTD